MNQKNRKAGGGIGPCSRRRLFQTALAGAGAMVAGGNASHSVFAASAGKAGAADIVTLGGTGIKTSRLAQGSGWNGGGRSSAHTRLGEKAYSELIRHGLDQGIRLMDQADLYGSHPYLRQALDGVPRDQYEILTKIWPRNEYWNMASGGAKEEVDRFRKELKTDRLDICLMHCMTNARVAGGIRAHPRTSCPS